TFACEDGWIAIGCGNDAIWSRLCGALGLDAARWPRNADRVAARAAVDAAVGGVLGGLTVADADARLARAGVPAGPVLRPEQTLAHPAVQLVRVDHPVLGPYDAPGPTLRTA